MMADTTDSTWWTLARSEEVTAKKPIAVDIGDRPVVLWRDTGGVVRALEDRCPHRRAPLSLGCIRDTGWIQCGYHGWSYDGETGRLKDIPNMKDEQRFPPLYRAERHAVAESGGLVRVALDPEAAPPPALADTLPLSGTAHVALGHADYVAAWFDDPGLLIAIRGLAFTPYPIDELHLKNDRLVIERSCQWKGLHWPSAFTSDFPVSLRSSTDPMTGETDLVLRDDARNVLLTAILAPTPAARGVTAVRWRARVGNVLKGVHARALSFGTPFKVREGIDAAALRVLKPSASFTAEALRRAPVSSTAVAA